MIKQMKIHNFDGWIDRYLDKQIDIDIHKKR